MKVRPYWFSCWRLNFDLRLVKDMTHALPKQVWTEWLAQKLGLRRLKRPHTISAEPLLLAHWWVLERLLVLNDMILDKGYNFPLTLEIYWFMTFGNYELTNECNRSTSFRYMDHSLPCVLQRKSLGKVKQSWKWKITTPFIFCVEEGYLGGWTKAAIFVLAGVSLPW